MSLRPLTACLALALLAPRLPAACCYFSALERDVTQPGQKAFLTWDPARSEESFTVQPKFEGDARDFGMVIPTPTQPTLDEMPRDFFKHLAVYTILLPLPQRIWPDYPYVAEMAFAEDAGGGAMPAFSGPGMPSNLGVRVLEAGVVGSLDYKILEATNPKGLFQWLEQNQYSYSGDQETLAHYIAKKWNFTVMKIDTKQMKKGPDGRFLGEVTPTRFTFESQSLVYPLRITQISVKDQTEAIFYIQAPEQMDLKGDWSWAHSYRTMWLNSGTVCISQKRMTPEERQELQERSSWLQAKRQAVRGYDTTKLEWAHRIGAADAKVLRNPTRHWGQLGFPDLPKDARRQSWAEFAAEAPGAVQGDPGWVTARLKEMKAQYTPDKGAIVARKEDPEGTVWYWFPRREAPDADVGALGQLKGHLEEGLFLTKFRKVFQKGEMTQDLEIVPAEDRYRTEYLRILPQSPP